MAKMRKEYDPNKVKQRKRKPIIYIVCEGKETEVLYFKHFRTRNCLVDIVPMTSKYTAAEHLVKNAKGLLSHADYFPKDGDQLLNMLYKSLMHKKSSSTNTPFLDVAARQISGIMIK